MHKTAVSVAARVEAGVGHREQVGKPHTRQAVARGARVELWRHYFCCMCPRATTRCERAQLAQHNLQTYSSEATQLLMEEERLSCCVLLVPLMLRAYPCFCAVVGGEAHLMLNAGRLRLS